MKRSVSILLFVLCATFVHANEIDKLGTLKDVQLFLERNKLGTNVVTSFFKLDIDNNGLTDLVINTDFCFVVLDTGGSQYKRCSLFTDGSCKALDVLHIKNESLLIIKNLHESARYFTPDKNDTLIFKYGGFMEYNSSPSITQIKRIKFSLYPTAISGSGLDLTLYSGGRVNDPASTIFVDTAAFNKLLQSINYIKPSSLRDNYAVDGVDLETSYLEIEYDDGQIKKINDYGVSGTFSLQNLYRQLLEIQDVTHK